MQVCTGSRRELGLFHLWKTQMLTLGPSLQFIGWCRTSEVGKDRVQCSHCNYFDFAVVLSCLVLLCIKVCVCQNHIPGRHFRLCRSSSLSLREIVSSGRSAKALHFWEKAVKNRPWIPNFSQPFGRIDPRFVTGGALGDEVHVRRTHPWADWRGVHLTSSFFSVDVTKRFPKTCSTR